MLLTKLILFLKIFLDSYEMKFCVSQKEFVSSFKIVLEEMYSGNSLTRRSWEFAF